MDSSTSPAQMAATSCLQSLRLRLLDYWSCKCHCVGQQQPVKEIRYIVFWGLYRVVAINGAKPQDSSIPRRVRTWGESRRQEEGWFLKSGRLLPAEPPLIPVSSNNVQFNVTLYNNHTLTEQVSSSYICRTDFRSFKRHQGGKIKKTGCLMVWRWCWTGRSSPVSSSYSIFYADHLNFHTRLLLLVLTNQDLSAFHFLSNKKERKKVTCGCNMV